MTRQEYHSKNGTHMLSQSDRHLVRKRSLGSFFHGNRITLNLLNDFSQKIKIMAEDEKMEEQEKSSKNNKVIIA